MADSNEPWLPPFFPAVAQVQALGFLKEEMTIAPTKDPLRRRLMSAVRSRFAAPRPLVRSLKEGVEPTP